MLIREDALKHWIDNFYGYGSWQARFWFIGPEEGGGDTPEEVADKINYFWNVHTSGNHTALCDIRELYQHTSFTVTGPRADLFTNLYDYRFDINAVQHGEWKNLIAFGHGYQNKPLPDLLEYQKKSFALTTHKKEALLRLYPLPAHNHAWYYSWLDLPQLSFLKSRALYKEHLYESRMETILTNVKVYAPEVVVMYSMETIDKIKKSVQEYFPGITFKMIKAVERVIPQYHHTVLGTTTMIITTQVPGLKHNRIETGFDWEAFGESLNYRI
jgi:uncharacterized protein with HEPN domain